MRNVMVVWMLAMTLGTTVGCDKDQNNNAADVALDNQTADDDLAVATDTKADVALATCPNEVALADSLPCDCFGTVVTDPTAQVQGCETEVVCCPAIMALRCEDYEHVEPVLDIQEDLEMDVAVPVDAVEQLPEEDIVETIEDLANVPVCPYEVSLATHTPCTCKGTLVTDVAEAMPDCTKKVVCCPISGVKCE